MKIDVEGLRVLVTAGGQGIGKAIVSAFMANGARVYTCDIVPGRLAALREELPGVGVVVADVGELEQVDRFVEMAVTGLGGVDVLVNNAGISGPAGPLEELDPDAWQQTLNVNLNGMFYALRRVVPQLKAQRAGAIVNIASTAGLFGYPWRTPYAASKWAVIGLTRSLAMELGAFNIRVNAICPGSINNPRMAQVIAMEAAASGRPEAEIRRAYTDQVSLRTFIEPEEIASLTLYLASPLAARISGQALSVDGNTETLRT